MQKQRKPEGGKPESADTLAGNKLAEMAGEKARAALSAISSAQAIAAPVITEAERRLNFARKIMDYRAVDAFGNVSEGERTVHEVYGRSAHQLARLIERGDIDEQTMQWRDKTRGLNGLICCCLISGCGIGPFIPFRR